MIGCSSKQETEAESEASIDITQLPSMIGDDIYTLISDSGKISYRMEAEKLLIYDQVDTPYWDFPQGLHITTYSEEGEPNGTITSKYAIYHVQDDLWELQDDVRAKSPKGERIMTELLFWDQKKELIYTDAYMEVIEEESGLVTKGYGFESDQSFDEWHIDDYEIEYYDE